MDPLQPAAANGEIRVSNEFADVVIRKVLTRNGERVEISAPRRGLLIELDPVELESITWQTTDTFSRFLESSLGPGREDP
jgi:hypothetical protein